MSEHSSRVGNATGKATMREWPSAPGSSLEVGNVAKVNLSSLWEALALASGIPPSTLHPVPAHQVPLVQADEIQFPHGSGQQGKVVPWKPIIEEQLQVIPTCGPGACHSLTPCARKS